MRFGLIVFLLLGISFAGCSKKESSPIPVQTGEIAKEAEVLPVLSQNNMYLTNRPEPVEAPNYSYSADTPTDNQDPPKGTKRAPLID